MRELFKIGSFIILLLLLTAEECSNTAYETSYEERQTAIFDGIENEFEKEQLGKEDLKAFENRALQMFTELIDYLNMYADTTLSKEFRMQSREMLTNLFASKEELELFMREFNLSENEQKGILYSDNGTPVHYEVLSDIISNNLTKHNDFIYSGRIRFKLSSYRTESNPEEKFLEFWLQKKPKQFGSDTLNVWEVFLATIK